MPGSKKCLQQWGIFVIVRGLKFLLRIHLLSLLLGCPILARCLQGKSWPYKVYLWKWSFLSFPVLAIWLHHFFDTIIVHYLWFNFALGLNYTCIFLWFGVTIMYNSELETKENKLTPQIKLDHNILCMPLTLSLKLYYQ